MTAKNHALVTGKVIPMPKLKIKREIIQTHFAISSNGKIDVIAFDQILFLKASSNYTELHLLDGTILLTSITLKRYERKLNMDLYIRVHSGFIIQNKFIKTYLTGKNKIILHNTQEIPVSRSRKESVMNHLKKMII